MNLQKRQSGNADFLINADYTEIVSANWFEKSFWLGQNKIIGSARGRGSTIFFKENTAEFVLRHYLRGGKVAKLSADKYIYTGLDKTRSFAELHLLHELFNQNLPVPEPIAARVIRSGLFYSADIIMQKIPQSLTLKQYIQSQPKDKDIWSRLGTTIRKFHHVGLHHADLNVNNILVTDNEIYLIDFDKSSLNANKNQKQNNLARLKRSMQKEFGDINKFKQIIKGYEK